MAEKKFTNESDSEVVSKIIDDVRKIFMESDSEMDLGTLARLEKIWISKLTGLEHLAPHHFVINSLYFIKKLMYQMKLLKI